jgi:hypothetical protein
MQILASSFEMLGFQVSQKPKHILTRFIGFDLWFYAALIFGLCKFGFE